jgi:ankyrin repeat protein
LIFAAHRGHTEIVELLLDAGVEAREHASGGATALHWAAAGGHPTVAKLMVDAGASLDAVDNWFALTPLGWATAVDWAPPSKPYPVPIL